MEWINIVLQHYLMQLNNGWHRITKKKIVYRLKIAG